MPYLPSQQGFGSNSERFPSQWGKSCLVQTRDYINWNHCVNNFNNYQALRLIDSYHASIPADLSFFRNLRRFVYLLVWFFISCSLSLCWTTRRTYVRCLNEPLALEADSGVKKA